MGHKWKQRRLPFLNYLRGTFKEAHSKISIAYHFILKCKDQCPHHALAKTLGMINCQYGCFLKMAP